MYNVSFSFTMTILSWAFWQVKTQEVKEMVWSCQEFFSYGNSRDVNMLKEMQEISILKVKTSKIKALSQLDKQRDITARRLSDQPRQQLRNNWLIMRRLYLVVVFLFQNNTTHFSVFIKNGIGELWWVLGSFTMKPFPLRLYIDRAYANLCESCHANLTNTRLRCHKNWRGWFISSFESVPSKPALLRSLCAESNSYLKSKRRSILPWRLLHVLNLRASSRYHLC